MSNIQKKNTVSFFLFFLFFSMSGNNPEGRTVEVLELPENVDEELLSLYFENRRRSGGGPLESVEIKQNRAVLCFEDAEGKWSFLENLPEII